MGATTGSEAWEPYHRAVLPAVSKPLIARLDPGSFTAFVEGLLAAERARLRLPPNALVSSDEIAQADGGLDGRLDGVPAAAPDNTPALLPSGDLGFQFKAVRKKQPSALGLDDELEKPGARRILSAGGTYVLVWSQDLNDPQRRAVEKKLREAAGRIVDDPKIKVYDAMALAGMMQTHPGVAVDAGLVSFGSALSLDELLEGTSLLASERPFVADQAREELIDRIRDRVARTEDPLLMSLLGDPGAGKTRTVAEALNDKETRDRVLYVNGVDGLGDLLTTLGRIPNSSGILFLDEIDDHDISLAMSRVSGMRGRWRLVTVTSRRVLRWQPSGSRESVLEPLSPDATERLVRERSGLPESQARLVAEIASGFPELAFRLAEELRDRPDLSVAELARLRRPEEVLRRALPDEQARRHLAPLALFSGVGFEEDLAYQVEAVAEAFELDAEEMKLHLERELGRFVSRAGRYRLVSPRLVAIWLALELIENTPAIERRIFALPEPVQDAFADQLEFFGPDVPHLPPALRRLLGEERFRSPTDFDEAAGRLLRASAAIVPKQVADTIGELLAACSPADLERLPRREIVWALEIVLWWPETWRSAIESMYTLARHENETWANNASAQFAQFFCIILSGTTVPYSERAAWLRERINAAAEDELPSLRRAAAAGLKSHHTRGVTGFRGGGEPRDWQPATRQEYYDARAAAMQLYLACLDRATDPKERHEAVKGFADALRTLYQSAQAEEVERQIRAREWTSPERSELTARLRDALRFEGDEMPQAIRDGIASLLSWLVGDDLATRAEVVLATPIWELYDERSSVDEPPPALTELAADILARNDALDLALASGRNLSDQDTRYRWLGLVARQLGPPVLGNAALDADPIDWPAVSASLLEADRAGEADWATAVLRRVAKEEPERVPELIRFTDLSPDRLELALDLIDEGRASAVALGVLLYGARIVDVELPLAQRVIAKVAEAGGLEQALGMLDQWLERHSERPHELSGLATRLAIQAASSNETMVEFYLDRLVESELLDGDALAAIWETRLVATTGLVDALDRRLTRETLTADPAVMLEKILSLVDRQNRGEDTFGLHAATDLGLLSRAAETLSAETVWERLRQLPERELRIAMNHMDWGGEQPDALVRLLLSSERASEVASTAYSCFYNTLGVVSGPMHLGLERQRDRARKWVDELAGTPGEAWARKLANDFEREIEDERQRHAEEHLRFG